MSRKNEEDLSEDEFEDALSDVPTTNVTPTVNAANEQQAHASDEEDTKSDGIKIEEIIEKQKELNLTDKDDVPVNKSWPNNDHLEEVMRKYEENSDYKLPDEDEEESAAAAAVKEKESNEEVIEDIIDESVLQEQEKNMSEEELLHNKEEADNLKQKGNEKMKNNDPEGAIDLYNEALTLCPSTYTKERAILYSNRAAAKIMINSKKSAIADCSKAIELWPEYVRAILRRAKLYESEDEKLEDALKDYERVLELDRGQREAREAAIRLPPIINERNERMKDEMMTQLKSLGNMFLKPFGLSTENFQMQKDPNTGGYSINFQNDS